MINKLLMVWREITSPFLGLYELFYKSTVFFLLLLLANLLYWNPKDRTESIPDLVAAQTRSRWCDHPNVWKDVFSARARHVWFDWKEMLLKSYKSSKNLLFCFVYIYFLRLWTNPFGFYLHRFTPEVNILHIFVTFTSQFFSQCSRSIGWKCRKWRFGKL